MDSRSNRVVVIAMTRKKSPKNLDWYVPGARVGMRLHNERHVRGASRKLSSYPLSTPPCDLCGKWENIPFLILARYETYREKRNVPKQSALSGTKRDSKLMKRHISVLFEIRPLAVPIEPRKKLSR